MNRSALLVFALAAAALTGAQTPAPGKTPTPAPDRAKAQAELDAAAVKQFDASIASYQKQLSAAASGLPATKSTDTPATLSAARREVADRLRVARANAHRGDIFTPAVSDYFRRVIAACFASPEGHDVRASLRHSEPDATMALQVNTAYPASVPLQSMPATLLEKLPPLPKMLEYRIIGRALILRDRESDLVLDWIPDGVPPM